MITAISKRVFDTLPNASQLPLLPHNGVLTAANGQQITVYGHCTLPIHFGSPTSNQVIDTQVMIADIRSTAILGINFMAENGVSIDFGTGQITIQGVTVFSSRGPADPKVYRLQCANTTYIPPRAESVITVAHKRAYPNITTPCIVNPSYRFTTTTGLFLGRSLVVFDNNKATALVINPSDEPVVIERGCNVGVSHVVDAVDMETTPEQFSINNSQAEPSRASPKQPTLTTLPAHLEQMIPKQGLHDTQTNQLRYLIEQYTDCFMNPGDKPGRTDIVHHTIDTGPNPPIRQRIRRIPYAQHDIIEHELDKMIEADVIEPSNSPWASPVVLVTKKDQTVRFCVDFRRLNECTVKDSYPLPNIEDTFNTMSGSNFFCALDLASGYWQIPMAQPDKEKTAFITRRGLFQFKVMPFGLCNAPATFERLMEAILRGLLWKRCMVYIDDIIVFGRSFPETLDNLQSVLQRLRDSQLKLKPAKCELFKTELLYLGFVISGSGVRPDPAKVQAVKDWFPPCNVSDIRSFLGFANYHRRFIKNYASIAAPLIRLTRKKVPFTWALPQQVAFEALKRELINAPVLSHAIPNHPFVLDTDASAFALGGVLSQTIDGREHVVAYASQTLSKSQVNYCTTHRELLAVIEMIRHFRHYLWGRKFLIRTDHGSLRWLLNYRDADGMLARWLTKLQQYHFVIEHRPGRLHSNADGLSRCHNCKNPGCPGTYCAAEPLVESSDNFFQAPHSHSKHTKQTQQFQAKQQSQPTNPLTRPPCISEYKPISPDSPPIPFLDQQCELITELTPDELLQYQLLDHELTQIQWLTDLTPDDLKTAQRADADLLPVINWLEEGARPSNVTLAAHSADVKSLVSR